MRKHEQARRAYVGPWLPEPIVADPAADPAGRAILDESVSMALLVVLDRMSAPERVAFVLHDVFGFEFAEIAAIAGRSSASCRQLASRARRRVRENAAVRELGADRNGQAEVAVRFAEACRTGDVAALIVVLAEDVFGDFDSGGVIPSAPTGELCGAESVARHLVSTVSGVGAEFAVADVNGDPGVVISLSGRIVAVVALVISGGRVRVIHAVGNPEKLRHL